MNVHEKEIAWWRLACQERMLELYDEYTELSSNIFVVHKYAKRHIPLVEKMKLDKVNLTNEPYAETIMSFVRQLLRHEITLLLLGDNTHRPMGSILIEMITFLK